MEQIRSHTGLRGLAALLVVAYHLQFLKGHLPIEDATTFFSRSYLMVDLFFVLSGFIIAYVYDINQSVIFTASEVKTFLLKRFIRIYPLHFLVLIVMLFYSILITIVFVSTGRQPPVNWSEQSIGMLGAQFILINAWLPGPNGWNIPSWSISAEFVAYLSFPLMVLCMAKRPAIACGSMLALITAFYILAPVDGSLDITGGVGAPLRCLAGFAGGFLIHAHRGWFARIGAPMLGIMQTVSLVWIVTVMITPVSDSYVIPAFMLLVAATWSDSGVIAKALSGKLPEKLGEISYSVYITHVFLISMINFIWERTGRRFISDPTLERSLFLVLCFAIVIFVSTILYARVERPVRAYLSKRWIPRGSPRRAVASA